MYEVEIIRMDHLGRGIGYINQVVTFIPYALVGEIVLCEVIEKKKNYNIAKIINFKKKDSLRVSPFCPYYEKCGGCHLEHMTYDKTLSYKKEKLENIFKKEKINYPPIEKVENPDPKNYRNKLSLKIKDGKLGFYQEKTNFLIEIQECALAKNCINVCIGQMKSLAIKNGEVVIRANYNDEILLIISTEDKVTFYEKDWKEVKLIGVIVNNKTIYGKPFFYERVGDFLFKVSYDAFFQINCAVVSKLFRIMDENIKKGDNVLDLYAGVGTLGCVASKKANKVYSIEIIKNAVLDNLENKKLNKCINVFPLLGDASKVVQKIKDRFDTILIDPPRKGLDKWTCHFLWNSEAKKIIYVSCNPLTLIRDLKELNTKYKIEKCYLLDMFSYTYHVECVCVLCLR